MAPERKISFSDERGFTLPEVLVTIFMMVLVLFALYSIFDTTLRVLGQGRDGVEAAADARAALSRMEREIRAAQPVGETLILPGSGGDTISFCSRLDENEGCTNITYRVNSDNDLVREEGGNAPVLASLGEEDASGGGGPGDECNLDTGGPDGSGGCLEFMYFSSINVETDPPDKNTSMVRIGMVVEEDRRKQILITNAALRNFRTPG